MVRKRSARTRRQITGGCILQLCCGRDFFRDGFGNGPDTDLAAMRLAWSDPAVRERVYARQQSKWPGAKPWAEIAFGVDGDRAVIPSDLPAIHTAYRQQREEVANGA